MPVLPAHQTTMIGSMPHLTPKEAFEALEQYPLTTPAWPQLPRRSFKEAMIPQFSEAFPGIQVDDVAKRIWVLVDDDLPNAMVEFYEHVIAKDVDAFAISHEYAAGLHGMLRQLANASTKLPLLKGHVTGPFTFGLGLADQERRSVWFDEQYRDIVLKGLGMKALWQIRQLQPYTAQVVIFFDEPVLSALGTPAYMMIQDEDVINGLNEVHEISHDAGALVGVHCCGNMDWGLLASTKIDIIAFDAYDYGAKVALYPDKIQAFLERGGMLASGLVPTGDVERLRAETTDSLKRKHESIIGEFVSKGIGEDLLRERFLFTPSCGMGTLSESDTATVLKLLAATQTF
jgi:methionine synthase II (cobalamin-independent)